MKENKDFLFKKYYSSPNFWYSKKENLTNLEMKINKLLVLIGFMLLRIISEGQDIKALNIGDTVPDFILHNTINYKDSIIRLSDFKDKLIILDFYGTWCGGCQSGIPKYDSLQKVFKDKIQVIVLCHDENVDIVRKTIQNRWKDRKLILPFVLAKDSKEFVNQLFPHKMVPHEVWISPKGTLIATTGADEVTFENIVAFLNGNQPELRTKKDLLNFDKDKPLIDNEGVINNLKYSSLITRHILGAGATFGNHIDTLTGRSRHYYINLSPLLLFRIAFGCDLENRIVLETEDSLSLYSPVYSRKWREQNTYCYEQTINWDVKESKRKLLMQTELLQFFGLSATWERRLQHCLVLKCFNNRKKYNKIKNLKDGSSPEGYNSFHLQYISQIINQISHLRAPIIIDESGYGSKIDLKIKNIDISNNQALRSAFKEAGFCVIEKDRFINMLVIK